MVDRSISMQARIGGQTKWDIATGAIDAMLTGYGTVADFGLMIYPYADDGGGIEAWRGMSAHVVPT